jgi:branched-chain amino acid transport system ATP-binding protein
LSVPPPKAAANLAGGPTAQGYEAMLASAELASESHRNAHSPLLEVCRLTKNFGGLAAVSDVSFTVQPGEIVGVIGPNGAGKTTLFALLGGFLPPTGGDMVFAGRSIAGLAPHQRCHLGIARTFQVVRPLWELTVYENVQVAAVFGKKGKHASSSVREDVNHILDATNLFAVARAFPPALSLPQRKRLEVARALATRPSILLLDEVLAGLNPTEVKEAIPFIKRVNEEHKITILMIEHNLRAIMGVSHRILVLNFGRLIFDGPPDKAVADPQVIQSYLGAQDHA